MWPFVCLFSFRFLFSHEIVVKQVVKSVHVATVHQAHHRQIQVLVQMMRIKSERRNANIKSKRNQNVPPQMHHLLIPIQMTGKNRKNEAKNPRKRKKQKNNLIEIVKTRFLC